MYGHTEQRRGQLGRRRRVRLRKRNGGMGWRREHMHAGGLKRGRATEVALHINAIMSPIPTRVYKLVTVMPRQISALTLSDWNSDTAFPLCNFPCPNTSSGKREIVPAQDSVYRYFTLAAAARPSTSPLSFRFSSDRAGRNQSIGTCAAPCHQEVALESSVPRNKDTSVGRPCPSDIFAPVPKVRQFQKLRIP